MRILLILTISFTIITQTAAQQSKKEKKASIEINQQATFYTVDKHYNLVKDTIYHSPIDFRIYPPSKQKTFKHECKTYYIIQYPNWGKPKSSIKQVVNKDTSIISNTTSKKTTVANTTKPLKKVPVHIDLVDTDQQRPASEKYLNNKILAIDTETFEKLEQTDFYLLKWCPMLTSGILVIPFKVRFPKYDQKGNLTLKSNLTTDVSLGPYLGFTWRINNRKKHYVTIPINAGLSIINLTNNTVLAYDSTSINTTAESTPDIVPGITLSTGAVVQLDNFTLGVAVGWDFAPGYVEEFAYDSHTWLSFSIGHNFLAKKED